MSGAKWFLSLVPLRWRRPRPKPVWDHRTEQPVYADPKEERDVQLRRAAARRSREIL